LVRGTDIFILAKTNFEGNKLEGNKNLKSKKDAVIDKNVGNCA
jgi:hypothetical protein